MRVPAIKTDRCEVRFLSNSSILEETGSWRTARVPTTILHQSRAETTRHGIEVTFLPVQSSSQVSIVATIFFNIWYIKNLLLLPIQQPYIKHTLKHFKPNLFLLQCPVFEAKDPHRLRRRRLLQQRTQNQHEHRLSLTTVLSSSNFNWRRPSRKLHHRWRHVRDHSYSHHSGARSLRGRRGNVSRSWRHFPQYRWFQPRRRRKVSLSSFFLSFFRLSFCFYFLIFLPSLLLSFSIPMST